VTALGIYLGAIGAADALAGFSGRPQNGARLRAAPVLAVVVALLGAALSGLGPGAAVALAVVAALSAVPWLAVRRAPAWSPRRAATTLWGVAATLVAMIALSPLWPDGGGLLDDWLGSLDLPGLSRLDGERLVFLVGSTLVLCATGNALVRLLLASVGTDVGDAEQRLRGGRVIGPMERALIFGFLVAGHAAAAALVVGAKSLLRFPEMRAEQDRIDELTEYFLVGSFASWLIAVGPALLAGP
jgi:hypothetical protein